MSSDLLLWVDGEPMPPDARHLSAQDRGLLLADGLFETMRVCGGAVFRLDQHLARLAASLRRLVIPEPPPLRTWISAAVRQSPAEAALRLTVTRGVGPGGLAVPPAPRPTTIVQIRPLHTPSSSTVSGPGLSARVASGRFNDRALTAGMKTLAYTEAIAALLEAQQAGADDAILLDTAGHCAAGSASNLFAVIDGVLVTAPLTCGVLPGITRAAVLEVATGLAIAHRERTFALEELSAASEVFLSSSLRGLAPLVRVNDTPIGAGTPGPLTRRLADSYEQLVRHECGVRDPHAAAPA